VFDQRLEALGGHANAATWLDWTFYHQDLPVNGLEEIITLEADRLQGLRFEADAFEAERSVVANERRECVDDDPGGRMNEALWRLAFDAEHPYGHPTIGWSEEIEALTAEDCQRFYRQHYQPSTARIVIAGAIDERYTLDLIEAAYGGLPSITPAPSRRKISGFGAGGRLNLTLPVMAPRLSIGLPAPTATDQLHLALELLHQVLFEGDSSRLVSTLLLERGWVSSLYATPPTCRGQGLYEICAELSPEGSLEEVEAAIFEALAKIAQRGLLPAELTKAKRQLELEAWRGLQTVSQRAEGLGFWSITGGDWSLLYQRPRRLQSIDQDALRECAALLLSERGRAVVTAQQMR
ncbi:MAG: pitrilysin family protein, partial [Myxococcota bacterium]|nr:pitrilysin family protein [Myxococcota bacterium]